MIIVKNLSACLGLVCLCLSLILSVCATGGASPEEAQAAAQAALDRMDGKPQTTSAQPSSSQTAAQSSSQTSTQPSVQQGPAVNTSKKKPAWVDSVDSVYGRAQYAAAVGYSSDRAMAEKNALANLTAIFGQSIYADQTITGTYQEAVRNGNTAGWTDNIEMQNTINTSALMDTLIGAEIKEVWLDSSKKIYYAAAVMEKAKTVRLYNDMILANQNMIGNLIDMDQREKNSLEGFSRFQFAAAVADINTSYGNLLKVIGASPPEGLKKGDDYRIEARNIAKSIPIGITVKNDKAERIQGAFAKALSGLGFNSGGTDSRYILAVNINITPVELANQTIKYSRIEMSANLTDTGANSVLLPFNFNSREGHNTRSEADNRAYLEAERKINDEYANILSDYLTHFLPKRQSR